MKVWVWEREPVLISGMVSAGLGLLVAFGVHLSDPQLESVKMFTAAALPLVGLIVARSQVTPVASPRLPDESPPVERVPD